MVRNKNKNSSMYPLPPPGLAALQKAAETKGVCSGADDFRTALNEMGTDLFPSEIWKWNAPTEPEKEMAFPDWRAIGDLCWKKGAAKEERRLAGSFYTPEPVIDRVLDLLWDDIIAGVETEDAFAPLCDPAMGCGFFFLRLIERLLDHGISLPEVRQWAVSNMYGVDKEAGAVLLARALLWLTLSDENERFKPDCRKLRCGDSLLGPGFGETGDGDGMDWTGAFPEVAGKGGFQIVLGNPPYEVLTNFKRHPASKQYAGKLRSSGWYEDSLSGQINLYRCFIERSLRLLRKGGGLSFVVPLSLARDGTAERLRRRLLWREKAAEWRLYGEHEAGFEGVTQSMCVFSARRGAGAAGKVGVETSGGRAEIGVEELEGFGGGVAAIPEAGENELRLWRWLKDHAKGRLEDLAETRVGEVDQTVYRECMRENDTGCILARGTHLQPFHLDVDPDAGGVRFLDLARFLAMKGVGAQTAKQRARMVRIVQLGIRNMRTQPRLVAGRAPEGVYLGNSLNVYYPRNGIDPDLLCGVLNSRLLNWMFCLGSGNNNINLREIDGLPFPDSSDPDVEGEVVKAARKCGKVAGLGGNIKEVRRVLDCCVERLYGVPDDLMQGVKAFSTPGK